MFNTLKILAEIFERDYARRVSAVQERKQLWPGKYFKTIVHIHMFWVKVKVISEIVTKTLQSLLPFPTCYLCEAGFSAMTFSRIMESTVYK